MLRLSGTTRASVQLAGQAVLASNLASKECSPRYAVWQAEPGSSLGMPRPIHSATPKELDGLSPLKVFGGGGALVRRQAERHEREWGTLATHIDTGCALLQAPSHHPAATNKSKPTPHHTHKRLAPAAPLLCLALHPQVARCAESSGSSAQAEPANPSGRDRRWQPHMAIDSTLLLPSRMAFRCPCASGSST